MDNEFDVDDDALPDLAAPPPKSYWGDLDTDNGLGVYAPGERHLKRLRGWSDAFPDDPVPNVIWLNWRNGVRGGLADRIVRDCGAPVVRGDGHELPEAVVVAGAIVHALLRAAVTTRCYGREAVVALLLGNHGRPAGADGLLPHFRTLAAVLDYMKAQGMIELHRSRGQHKSSWMRAGPNFNPDLSELQYFCAWERGLVQIRLAGDIEEGGTFCKTLPPEVQHGREQVREQLVRINTAVSRLWERAAVCDLNGRWRQLPHGDFCYQAVFNDGRLDRGGRNYAPFQNLPNRTDHIRETLHWRINGRGRPTVELDVVACHPSMLYHEQGLRLPDGDLHSAEIPGWFDPANPDPDKRELLKAINNALPNCGDQDATPARNRTTANQMAAKQYILWKKRVAAKYAAMGKPVPPDMWLPGIEPEPAPRWRGTLMLDDWTGVTEDDYWASRKLFVAQHRRNWAKRHKRKYTDAKPKDIVTALLARHAPLADKMFSGQGLRLQSIDGAIARAVLLYFVERDKPIVCMHDSFMCLEEDEALLRERIQLEYMARFGFLPRIEKKAKKRRNLPPIEFE